MKEKASICLCMIAKDEEKNIERCIQSSQGLVDEIVLVDTGSSDNTVELARRLGARVYNYQWDDSFANARNFAISKAESDWLLLLDADEALDKNSFSTIVQFIETTSLDGAHLRMRNYTGRFSPDHYSLHSALRLLRNNKKYRFEGEIHEQVVSDECEKISDRFIALDVVVHHYGYLDEIVREKQKRRRNIPILEKQLEQNPKEPFTLFNMGNEYLSMQEYQTALQYYEKALEKIENRRIAFVPHLFFRIINCYENLGDHEKALRTAQEGLGEYPGCTDYAYLRADILHRCKRYSLAIDGFEICLNMGTPPMPLEFLPGCGTYRAAYQLGELYREIEDYGRAVRYYDLALSHKQDLYGALYRMGEALNKLYEDKEEVYVKLFSCFADPKYTPNTLLGADILIKEGLYTQALKSLEGVTDAEGRETELSYVKGRALFYRQQFDDALPLLNTVCAAPEPAQRVLRGVRPMSAMMLFAMGVMQNDMKLVDESLVHIKSYCTPGEHAAAMLMKNVFLELPQDDPHYPDEGKAELTAMLQLLDMFLKCCRFELFEQMLNALNYVDAKEVLLRLAQLFADNGTLPLAAEYVLRSIREMDYIDAAGAGILFRQVL